MEPTSTLLELVATVCEVIRRTDEYSCRGDSERAVHVQVDAENHSVLGTIIFVSGFLPFAVGITNVLRGDVQIELIGQFVVL
ncbi:hypothetical protein C495_00080 [Natronorubrum sulfidifaciens JCM 14089]|uniref:Uncharacterized protein n=1 Tax=Natronorubrum sulfidifaciens JCM 14089 TaxID=1230460 RepID=L9WJF5_9EURY|nr:hypothetical protein C495_00080 [Natronorubrum sulfidifaciens JCM 14089]